MDPKAQDVRNLRDLPGRTRILEPLSINGMAYNVL